jgi:hypothetical protein
MRTLREVVDMNVGDLFRASRLSARQIGRAIKRLEFSCSRSSARPLPPRRNLCEFGECVGNP